MINQKNWLSAFCANFISRAVNNIVFIQPPKLNIFCLVTGFWSGRFFLTLFLMILFFLTRHFVATFFSLTNTASQTVGILDVVVIRCFCPNRWRFARDSPQGGIPVRTRRRRNEGKTPQRRYHHQSGIHPVAGCGWGRSSRLRSGAAQADVPESDGHVSGVGHVTAHPFA